MTAPRGYDAEKKIKGPKRHALVATEGRGLILRALNLVLKDLHPLSALLPELVSHKAHTINYQVTENFTKPKKSEAASMAFTSSDSELAVAEAAHVLGRAGGC